MKPETTGPNYTRSYRLIMMCGGVLLVVFFMMWVNAEIRGEQLLKERDVLAKLLQRKASIAQPVKPVTFTEADKQIIDTLSKTVLSNHEELVDLAGILGRVSNLRRDVDVLFAHQCHIVTKLRTKTIWLKCAHQPTPVDER